MTYCEKIASHLDRLTAAVIDPEKPMWPSVLDVRTGRFPEGDHVPGRVYRLIGAPRGSTLYWDQPSVVAAFALSALTDTSCYADAADAYIRSFLDLCVERTGTFLWGNHVYYDLFASKVIAFHGGYHELRPITPAWDVFWRHDPDMTRRYIRTMARAHVYDPTTGGFNRHDDGKPGHAFLEAGGILAESLAWLSAKTGEEDLREQALRIARYSYGHRDSSTGLVMNEPDMGRWDSKVSTTEVGLWAQCLLRAGGYTSQDEFTEMALSAVRAYLEHAYDDAAGLYFGQVAVDTGEPVLPDEIGYWPRKYADAWNTDQWPNHDYPMALAEACLSLHAISGKEIFLEAIRRWARHAIETSPGRGSRSRTRACWRRLRHWQTRR